MSRSPLRRAALLATALTVSLTTVACTADAGPEPHPTRSPSSTQKPTEEPREVTFGAYGSGNASPWPRLSTRVGTILSMFG